MAAPRERFPLRRVAQLVGWNALVLFALLLLAAGGAEVWLRLTVPFRDSVAPQRLAPGVGFIRPPHREFRFTNGLDYWAVSRTNSLGFLDREPPDAERAAESCHVTFIGDSFVEGREVAIEERAQVRLEELAARELPELDVTTSAFGFQDTGQINQLAFYDAYARGLSPDVVALVFVRNDFIDNSLPQMARDRGFSPDHPPHLYARRGADGEIEFAPLASSLEEVRANLLPRLPPVRASLGSRVEWKLREWSYLADRLWIGSGHVRRGFVVPRITDAQRLAWAESLGRDPRHAALMDDWARGIGDDDPFLWAVPPPAYRDALDVMRFALEQFRERAERDGAALVILASDSLFGEGHPRFELLRGLAADVGGGGGIPVISQYDYIIDKGGEVWKGQWRHDFHWNAAGHRWAAEAILEWLKEHPEVCD